MRIWLVVLAAVGCKAKEAPAPAPSPAPAPPAPALSVIDQAATVGTIEAWDAAAKQLDAQVAACTADCSRPARDAVTAHGQALKLEFLGDPGGPLTPMPLPARATSLISSCDAFAKVAEATDPELPSIELIAARQQSSYGWRALAIPRYEEILREHRDSEAAGLTVAPLLDALRREGRGADMRRWIDSLRADTKFLSAHPDLRDLLESLHAL